MNLTDITALILGALQSATTDAQKQAIGKWALLALKAWDAYGEVSAQFSAVAAKIDALAQAGWQLNDILAEYAATEAALQADFDALRAAP